MTSTALFGESKFDDGDDVNSDDISRYFSDLELQAGSGKTTKFAKAEIDIANNRIDLAGVLPKFEQWAIDDREYRGGRRPVLDDRAILVAIMLLRGEGSPILVSEIANVFRYRLTKGALTRFDIPVSAWNPINELDITNWYNRAFRSLHRILARMDPWATKGQRHTRAERVAVKAARVSTLKARNNFRLKQERLEWFSTAMLNMTYKTQPRWLRRRWKGGLSVDQTSVVAPSQSGPRKRDSKGDEIPLIVNGVEVERMITEIDAGWYPKKFAPSSPFEAKTSQQLAEERVAENLEKKKKDSGPPPMELTHMANITITAKSDPRKDVPIDHPTLAMAVTMNEPNKDVGGQTVRAMQSIRDNGHHIAHLTFDRGYRGVDGLLEPLRDMKIPVNMGYKLVDLGIHGSAGGGTMHVEGAHYCPATPEELLESSKNFEEGSIDWDTWQTHLQERIAYEVRPLEKLDESGKQPVACPAWGPSATVDCPIRAKHPGRPKKFKARPKVLIANIPKDRPTVCTAAKSVSIDTTMTTRHNQMNRYGLEEWDERYTSDRNAMEGFNAFLTRGPERLAQSADRRVHGLAAQAFIVTMLLVSANLRKIVVFLQDHARITPKKIYLRGRDIRGESNYANAKRRTRQPKIKSTQAADPPQRT